MPPVNSVHLVTPLSLEAAEVTMLLLFPQYLNSPYVHSGQRPAGVCRPAGIQLTSGVQLASDIKLACGVQLACGAQLACGVQLASVVQLACGHPLSSPKRV